jgi:glycosyltransferase involved in cell wall biosynthesis
MIIIIMILLLIFLSVALYNHSTAPVFRAAEYNGKSLPLVSILIPARNEEENIYRCLKGVSEQDYTNIEILVGDDHSTDNTTSIIDEFCAVSENIKKIDIPDLPDGWKGKNFAAHCLADSSRGEILLFIDADVMLNKNAVSSAVSYMDSYKADILSVFPGQIMKTFGEKLVVPLLNFFLLSLLPLLQVYKSEKVSFSAGIGQFIMFRRKAYHIIGGHASHKNLIAEDMEMIRSAKKYRMKVISMLDQGLAACRMYKSLPEAVDGFTKNFFKGSSLPAPLFILFISVYCFVLFAPFVLIFFHLNYILPVGLIFVIQWIITDKSGQPLYNIIFHPFQILILYFVALRSLFGVTKLNGKEELFEISYSHIPYLPFWNSLAQH